MEAVELFSRNSLFPFQPLQTLLVSGSDSVRVGAYDQVDDPIDVLLELRAMRGQVFAALAVRGDLNVPDFPHHSRCQLGAVLAGAHGTQKGREFSFQLVSGDRLAFGGAASFEAEIVGVATKLALRPARCERIAAFAAQHEISERKFLVQIGAGGHLGFAVELVLDFLKCLQ